jgi:ParB family chromosome partitioning protein
MSQIVNVPLSQIDPNPSRLLKKYPYVQAKLDALERSMKNDNIGCWEGIIARRNGERFQIAFGHHRVKAAKNIGLKSIPLIVRQLTDKQMVQFLGRENLDDYQASFPVLLETWEAADAFLSAPIGAKDIQSLDIARLLGWISRRREAGRVGEDQLTHIARSCSAAHKLITGGYIERDSLADLSTRAAMEIVERAWSRMEQLDRISSQNKRSHAEVERAKKQIAKGAKETVREVKAGRVAQRDIRSRVDVNAYRHAKAEAKISPLFDAFGKALAESISKMLSDDAATPKLQAVVDALGKIETESDQKIVERLLFELGGLEGRAEKWQQRLARKPAKISHLKAIQ